MTKFTEIFNEEYDKLFMDVLKAGLDTRDQLMESLYEKSIADESLSDKQKELIKKLHTTYKFATFSTKYEPLSLWYMTKTPNLKKIIFSNKNKRLRRATEDLAEVLRYLEDWSVMNTYFNFPTYMAFIVDNYHYDQENDNKNRQVYPSYIIAALSKYCRSTFHDILYTWYLAVFFKNVELLSTTKKEDILNLNKLDSVKRLFSLVEVLSNDRIMEELRKKQQEESVTEDETDNKQELHE